MEPNLEILKFITISFIVICGAKAARLILFIAPEELSPGRKWFKISSSILIGFSAIMLTKNLALNIFIFLVLLNSFFIGIKQSDYKSKNKNKKIILVSVICGIIYSISYNPSITGSILFLFFMTFSSLMLNYRDEDVDYKHGTVKNKITYIKNIMIPISVFLIPIFLKLFFYLIFS